MEQEVWKVAGDLSEEKFPSSRGATEPPVTPTQEF